MPRQYPDLPCGDEMVEPAVAFAVERERYTSDEFHDHLAAHYRLSAEDLALRLRRSGRLAFRNYVDHLLRRFTRNGIHVAVGDQCYAPKPIVAALADAFARGLPGEARAILMAGDRRPGEPRCARDCGGRQPARDREAPRAAARRGGPLAEAAHAAGRETARRMQQTPPIAPGEGAAVLPQAAGMADAIGAEQHVAAGAHLACVELPCDGQRVPSDAAALPGGCDVAAGTPHCRAQVGASRRPPIPAAPGAGSAGRSAFVMPLAMLQQIAHELSTFKNLTPSMSGSLAAAGVTSVEALADLKPHEAARLLGEEVDVKTAYWMVMSARSFVAGTATRRVALGLG
jgi:hypothetical protein